MSYRAGVGPALARVLGIDPGGPCILCDGCGVARSVYRSKRHFAPAKWLLNGRPAPGWTGGRKDDHTREDYCPECSRKRAEHGTTK